MTGLSDQLMPKGEREGKIKGDSLVSGLGDEMNGVAYYRDRRSR